MSSMKIDDNFLKKEFNTYLKSIENRCKEIFIKAIQESVYDYYSPKEYQRTYQLLNNVRTEIKNNVLYVYVNTGNMIYTSAVDNRKVTKAVPYWVQKGHDDGIGNKNPGENQYHRYEGRHYLENAKEKIKKELGIDVEIVNDEPEYV